MSGRVNELPLLMHAAVRLPDGDIIPVLEATIKIYRGDSTAGASDAMIVVRFWIDVPLNRAGIIIGLDLDIGAVLRALIG